LINIGLFSFFVILKSTISILILSVMMLHASSRLGVLTYFYQNKDRIAFSLGLASEPTITECSSEFYFADRLTIADNASETHSNILPIAHEIHLFFVGAICFTLEPMTCSITLPAALTAPQLSEGVAASLLRPPIFS
jgi:type IV secretory pathway VirB3-like protein